MSPVIISETTNLYSINLHMKFFSEFAGKLDKNASIEGPITNIQYLSFFIVCYMFKIACAYKSIPGTSSYRDAIFCLSPNIRLSAVSTS